MANITDIADAVAAELNAGTFDIQFTAERCLLPFLDVSELETLHVSVVPSETSMEFLTRQADLEQHTVDVAVQKKLEDITDQTEIEALMSLTRQIAGYLRRKKLTAMPEAGCVKTVVDPIYSYDHLLGSQCFTSVVKITYKIIEMGD